jgi:hypothetical protein
MLLLFAWRDFIELCCLESFQTYILVLLFLMLNVLYFYVSVVANMAVFCFFLILCFPIIIFILSYFYWGCTNPRHQVAWVTKCCTVAPSICKCSEQNLPYTRLLAPRILKWTAVLKYQFHMLCIIILNIGMHVFVTVILYRLWDGFFFNTAVLVCCLQQPLTSYGYTYNVK